MTQRLMSNRWVCGHSDWTKPTSGFTLIELLVVISIIALLLSILMPSLRKAKQMAQRTVCLSNEHQLGLAWVLYTDNNDGKLVGAWTGYGDPQSGQDLDPSQGGEMGWVDWNAHGPFGTTYRDDEQQQQIDDIQNGVFYPYAQTEKVYKCPARAKKGQFRSYSIVESMRGWVEGILVRPQDTRAKLRVTKAINIRSPSRRAVFLCEGAPSKSGWLIWYHKPQWSDPIPIRHGEGTALSYADGHSDAVKWKNTETIENGLWFKNGAVGSAPYPWLQYDNEDLEYMQKMVWGKRGYNY